MIETQPQDSHNETEASAQSRGLVVIGALAVLTVIEFIIAVAMDGGNVLAALLGVVALIKAILIIQYFMHFHQLWQSIAEVWQVVVSGEDEKPEETEAHD